MSELAETASTNLEQETTTTGGGGQPSLSEPKADESAGDSLRAIMKAEANKADDKPPKEEVKAEAENPVAKPVEKEEKAAPTTETGRDATEQKQEASPSSESEKRHEAPARFSESAKAVWRNAPREVQNEVARWERESEETKPHLERYAAIREFDEMAKANGRELRDSLTKMAQIENMMTSNPIGALNMILQEVGPRKADGGRVSLMEVAQHIVNQGQEGYHRSLQAAQQQQLQDQQRAQMTQQQSQQEQQNRELMRLAFVEPFRAANPRYDELEGHIAMVLKSDMIDKSLSPAERLAKAYELAERIYPASGSQQSEQRQALETDRRADQDFSGSKSIKSSPGLVTDEDMEDRAKPGESILDSIQAEARRLKRA